MAEAIVIDTADYKYNWWVDLWQSCDQFRALLGETPDLVCAKHAELMT